MRGSPQNKRLFRSMTLFCCLMLLVPLLELYLLRPDTTVIAWTMLITLGILGGCFCVLPMTFSERDRVLRRSRARHRGAWILCELMGILFLGTAVATGMTWTLGRDPVVAALLMNGVVILVLVSVLLIGGLGVISEIAKGHAQTRPWAGALDQRATAPGAEPTSEDTPTG